MGCLHNGKKHNQYIINTNSNITTKIVVIVIFFEYHRFLHNGNSTFHRFFSRSSIVAIVPWTVDFHSHFPIFIDVNSRDVPIFSVTLMCVNIHNICSNQSPCSSIFHILMPSPPGSRHPGASQSVQPDWTGNSPTIEFETNKYHIFIIYTYAYIHIYKWVYVYNMCIYIYKWLYMYNMYIYIYV